MYHRPLLLLFSVWTVVPCLDIVLASSFSTIAFVLSLARIDSDTSSESRFGTAPRFPAHVRLATSDYLAQWLQPHRCVVDLPFLSQLSSTDRMPVSDCVHASLTPRHHGPLAVLFLCQTSEPCPGHRVSLGVQYMFLGAIAWSGGHVALGARQHRDLG
jgi:hypothetical protein